ncbi:MAG: MoaD/ThiS family protein [Anaerolineae bacterium]
MVPSSQKEAPSSIRVTLRLFAAAREACGKDRLEMQVPVGSTPQQVAEALCQMYPALQRILTRSTVAVNREVASRDFSLSEGDEVAFLPPVGGG